MTSAFRLFIALCFALQLPLSVMHSEIAHAKGKSSASKKADNDDEDAKKVEIPSPDNENDSECEGDPFKRCESATMKNQNCDPTFLLDLYKNFRTVNCLGSYAGVCFNPTSDDTLYGLQSGLVGFGTGLGVGAARQLLPVVKQLAAHQEEMNLAIQELRAHVGKEVATAGAFPKNPKALLEAEKKISFRRFGRAGLWGLLAGLGMWGANTFWDSEYRQRISEYINNLRGAGVVCTDDEELDENFKKYVPVEPGTCRTPIYTPGHPRVLDFLELPTDQKLKILRDNKLVCGYYKSLNNELQTRIDQMNGKAKIRDVQCNANGDIVFMDHKKTHSVFFKIHRDPKSKDLLSYSYEDRTGDMLQEAATFDLTKDEDDDSFTISRTRVYNSEQGFSNRYANDDLVKFARSQPEQAKRTFDAFRTIRRFAPQLAVCCDSSPPELKEYRKSKPDKTVMRTEQRALKDYNHVCPPAWFNRSAQIPAVTSPSSSRK